jgi:hypothetical protein
LNEFMRLRISVRQRTKVHNHVVQTGHPLVGTSFDRLRQMELEKRNVNLISFKSKPNIYTCKWSRGITGVHPNAIRLTNRRMGFKEQTKSEQIAESASHSIFLKARVKFTDGITSGNKTSK